MLQSSCVPARGHEQAIRHAWSEFVGRRQGHPLAQSADWFWNCLPWLSTAPDRLRFVLIHESGRLAGLFPIEEKKIVLRRVPLKCLGFIDGPFALPNSAILVDGDVEAVCDTFASHLVRHVGGWRCVSLAGLDLDSPLGAALLRSLTRRGIAVDRPPDIMPYLSCASGWEAYLASRSANFRRNMRRSQRELEAAGPVEYRPAPDGADGFDAVEEIDRRSWRMQKPLDVERNASLTRYCRKLLDVFPERDRHIVRLLTVDGAPVASTYAFVHRDVAYALKVNFDLAVARGSPGLLLLLRLIEELAGRGIQKIEFIGRNEYLHRLGTASRRMSKSLVFNRRGSGLWMGVAAWSAYRIMGRTSGAPERSEEAV